jgi:sterol desaturase/sphingolipid hydroxylase (fatty acid hydroxylase superfamily)
MAFFLFAILELAIEATVPALAFFGLTFLICAPLEGLLPVEGHQAKHRGRWADFLHALINPVLISVSAVLVVVLTTRFHPMRVLGKSLGILHQTEVFFRMVAQLPGWAAFILATLLSSFMGYWIHRALHRWPPLWRFHAVHHSSEKVDWLSAHRQHPMEAILIVAATLIPPTLLGLSPPALFGFAIFRKIHIVLSHTHTRLHWGWLRFAVVTPRHHHWHHEIDARCNYAGIFPIWDLLFGTYFNPGRHPEKVGCDVWVRVGYLQHLVHPLRKMRPRPPQVPTLPPGVYWGSSFNADE